MKHKHKWLFAGITLDGLHHGKAHRRCTACGAELYQDPTCAERKRHDPSGELRTMKAYVIISRDEKSLFGREDGEFFGAIWFYPRREIAEKHCGPAGKVIEIDVRFPNDVAFTLAKRSQVKFLPRP